MQDAEPGDIYCVEQVENGGNVEIGGFQFKSTPFSKASEAQKRDEINFELNTKAIN